MCVSLFENHSSLSSFHAVGEMRTPSMTDFLWGLENSGWLKHIKAILDAGVFISRVCTRVHRWRRSDDWDNFENADYTTQIVIHTTDWMSLCG